MKHSKICDAERIHLVLFSKMTARATKRDITLFNRVLAKNPLTLDTLPSPLKRIDNSADLLELGKDAKLGKMRQGVVLEHVTTFQIYRYIPYENDLQAELKTLKEKVHAQEVEMLKDRLKRMEQQNQQLQATNMLVMHCKTT